MRIVRYLCWCFIKLKPCKDNKVMMNKHQKFLKRLIKIQAYIDSASSDISALIPAITAEYDSLPAGKRKDCFERLLDMLNPALEEVDAVSDWFSRFIDQLEKL